MSYAMQTAFLCELDLFLTLFQYAALCHDAIALKGAVSIAQL
jgi:hypothetical protein